MNKDLKKYLDSCIKHWRWKLENSKNRREKLIAKCYIDAFQSVRISILGELLCYPQTIKTVVLYQTTYLTVSDKFGIRIPKYEGHLEEKHELILRDSTEDTKFYISHRGWAAELSKGDYEQYVIKVFEKTKEIKEEK